MFGKINLVGRGFLEAIEKEVYEPNINETFITNKITYTNVGDALVDGHFCYIDFIRKIKNNDYPVNGAKTRK